MNRAFAATAAVATLALAACSSSTPKPVATSVTSVAGPATTSAAVASSSAAVDNGLTALGATQDYWDAHRNPDGDAPAIAPAYGPDTALPRVNGRTGDKYTLLTGFGGYVTGYQVNFAAGTGESAALSDVLKGEFPADAVWLWKHETPGQCYQGEVRSARLKAGLTKAGLGDGSGEAFVELQTVVPGGSAPDFDPRNVTYATLSLMSYGTVADAPGC